VFLFWSDAAIADLNNTIDSSNSFVFKPFGNVINYKVIKPNTVIISRIKGRFFALAMIA
jgi:hypothetical protein